MADTPDPGFGLQELIGFTLESVEGRSVAHVEVAEHHLNPHGIVHGAIPFTLMDTAMGGAVMSTLDDGRQCATIEMQTRYHRPASGGTLTATAKVTSGGRRIVHLAAETRDHEQRLVASATASFAVFQP